MGTHRALADLNWQDYGGDGDPMVLVHGLAGSIANWNAVGPRLAEGFRVMAIDLPGFGMSPPRENYRFGTHGEAVVDFIEHLQEPAVLLGNSMGGLVCEHVAARRPGLVSKLVLVAPATPVRVTDPELNWWSTLRLGVESIPWIGEKILKVFGSRYGPEKIVDLSLRLISNQHQRIPPDVVIDLVDNARARAALPWAGRALNRSASSIAWSYRKPRNFVSMIRDITAPTLVIQGVDDPVVSPSSIRWLTSLRLDWDLIQMKDTGHIPQLDSPVRFANAVMDWLEGQGS